MPTFRKLHIACGPITGTIYAGTVDKTGQCWSSKQDVTNAAIGAVCEHAMLRGGDLMVTLNGKPKYKVTVEEIAE